MDLAFQNTDNFLKERLLLILCGINTMVCLKILKTSLLFQINSRASSTVTTGPNSDAGELGETRPSIYVPLVSNPCPCLLEWLYQRVSTRLDLPQGLPLIHCVCICAS